jgi:[acyl-carrier-protein] S-malonyltransferase
MSKIAFLFPGQGSQFAGMGKSLADNFPAAAAVFAEADAALGFPISALCFEGSEEDLKKTENTQPALLAVSIAAYRVLEVNGIKADFVAGHSLGEYSAVVAAGGLQFADAIKLVRDRGRYMQEAVPQGVGGMAAILRLADGKLDRILAEAAQGEVVTAANFNSPEQVVIAGHAGAVHRAMQLAKAAGAKRAIALPVSAPFHCPLMKPAQERMARDLEAATMFDLHIPLINNVEARAVRTAADARRGLIAQIPNPVRWTDTIRFLGAQGVTRTIEVGAGNVLTGLLGSFNPGLQGTKFGDAADLEKICASVA